jgi:hypothetical protein
LPFQRCKKKLFETADVAVFVVLLTAVAVLAVLSLTAVATFVYSFHCTVLPSETPCYTNVLNIFPVPE